MSMECEIASKHMPGFRSIKGRRLKIGVHAGNAPPIAQRYGKLRFPGGGSERNSVYPGHAHVFDLEELLDTVLRPLRSDAGLLHAAKRSYFVGNHTSVYANHTEFELLADAPGSIDTTSINITSKPVRRIVGDLYSFLFRFKQDEWGDRPDDPRQWRLHHQVSREPAVSLETAGSGLDKETCRLAPAWHDETTAF